jgi:hypothetical protein
MSEQATRPEPQDEPLDSTVDDETEVVPHSADSEDGEELPWCVGNFG